MLGFVRGSLVAYALPLASWLKYSNVEYISGVRRRRTLQVSRKGCCVSEREAVCLGNVETLRRVYSDPE